eukprot:Hpha_TRINITY_DN15834_c0_g3::TRINITY_DN15834_c0_g3_i3::g.190511::m.190511
MADAAKPDLSNYRKVKKDKKKPEGELPKGTYKVGPVVALRKYIGDAIDHFEAEGRSAVFEGRGRSVSKVIAISEIVKRHVKGLHTISEVTTDDVVDVYEKKKKDADGPDTKEVKVTLSGMRVTLTLDKPAVEPPGYQAPIPEDQVTPEDKEKRKRAKRPAGGRGRGKGGKAGRGKGGRGLSGQALLKSLGLGNIPTRGGGARSASRGGKLSGPVRSRGGGGGGQVRSRGGGAPSRGKGAGKGVRSRGGGGGPAPVRSRGGGGRPQQAPRSRGGGGGGGGGGYYGAPPVRRSRGGGAPAGGNAARSRGGGGGYQPPRSRGGYRQYAA